MIKIVTLFLVGIVVLALVGRRIFPGRNGGVRGIAARPRKPEVATFRKCKHCGKYLLDAAQCDCGKDA